MGSAHGRARGPRRDGKLTTMIRNQLTREQSAIVGRKVRALRISANWTQAYLGKLVERSGSRISRMESGERLFVDEDLVLLAAIFGRTRDDLLPGCANCAGVPRPGFACLVCGAETPAAAHPVRRAAAHGGAVPVGVFGLGGRRRLDVSSDDIIRMRDQEGMSFPAISRKVGMSVSGVKRRYADKK
jgi:hypothetical protein